jgi:murein L,D-transpeptidase YcbB/YkuD
MSTPLLNAFARFVAITAAVTAAVLPIGAMSTQVDDLTSSIRDLLTRQALQALAPSSTGEAANLGRLYEEGAYAPLWVDTARKPGSQARAALLLLSEAGNEGLDPQDYGSAQLEARARALQAGDATDVAQAARFDVELSASMLRYLRHVSSGRVDPRSAGFLLDAPSSRPDVVLTLRRALEGGELSEAGAGLAPATAQYRALRGMLARYRALAATPGLEPLPKGRTLHPGDSITNGPALVRWLTALGDLPGDALKSAGYGTYEGALVEGVKRFQARHGLIVDGVIGGSTWAALSVPLGVRVRQIELAMERLRWLPDVRGGRLVVLNIPMFHLWAWDREAFDSVPAVAMRTVVGTAKKSQTPVMSKAMHELIFRPYWNIPSSILHNEILPEIDRHPGYLTKQDMEIVDGPGDDAKPVPATEENLARLREGSLRLRQRPGILNALGNVKFAFPNGESIYFHDTPARKLFARARRDFSHGCVRLEDPVGLAEWVLSGEADWGREQVLAAMADTAPVSRTVRLTKPIPVLLFYTTALVMPEDGTLHFAEDVYGLDAELERLLASPAARQSAR